MQPSNKKSFDFVQRCHGRRIDYLLGVTRRKLSGSTIDKNEPEKKLSSLQRLDFAATWASQYCTCFLLSAFTLETQLQDIGFFCFCSNRRNTSREWVKLLWPCRYVAFLPWKVGSHLNLDLVNTTDPSSVSSSIPCLTAVSFDTCSLAIEQLNLFLELLTSYIADTSIESEGILSIVSNSSELVHSLSVYQHFFIEFAIDDYLFLDEHCHSVYGKVLVILNQCQHFHYTNSELYHLEQTLLSHLPSNYSTPPSGSLPNRIASTLIEQTSLLLSSSGHALANHDVDNNHDGVLPSNFLFSTAPVSISLNDENAITILHDRSDQGQSLLQLDKIDIHTTILSRTQAAPSFPLDFTDLEQIEDDLSKQRLSM